MTDQAFQYVCAKNAAVRTRGEAVEYLQIQMDVLRRDLRDVQTRIALAQVESIGLKVLWGDLEDGARDAVARILVLGCRRCGLYIAEYAEPGWVCGGCREGELIETEAADHA